MYKISIITCTFNSAIFLKKNINSVINQSFKNFEHIFIDGFSNDGTVEIIKEYQKKFPNQVKIFQFKPAGISMAMNDGIKKAQGDYLIHLHSDDSFFDNDVLRDVDNFLFINNYPDWIYGKCNVVEENGVSVGIHPKRKIFQNNSRYFWGRYFLKFYNFIPHQAVFIKKEVFSKFGYFDESIKSSMDPDLWLRIRNKTRWIFFDKIISNYCIRSGARSSSIVNRKENKKNYWLVQKRYLRLFEIPIAYVFDFIIEKRNKTYR